MATQERNEADSLTGRMLADPTRADFFLLVRALQAEFPPDFPRVGEGRKLGQDLIRFGQPPHLHFPPVAMDTVRRRLVQRGNAQGGEALTATEHKIYQYFFGLFGPNGALPLHLTEHALNRWRHHKDPVLVEFADLFHNRMVAFFYRAWASARIETDLDRGIGESRFAGYLGSLCGLGQAGTRQRDSVGEMAKVFYAGILGRQVRSADGLRDLLSDYFQVPVEIRTFQGRWIELPKSSRCRLRGSQDGLGSGGGELGRNALLGARVWDCQLTFRIRLGPIGLDQVRRFLPGGKSFARLKDWVRLYCSEPLFWDAQLVLRRDEVKPIQLGQGGGSDSVAGRLGWTTWLATRPMASDAEDLLLHPEN